jgi:uncharacterized protein with von Willebrand factor type A (vWA) domain
MVEDLLKFLDKKGEESSEREETTFSIHETATSKKAHSPATDHALAVDGWGKRQGEQLKEDPEKGFSGLEKLDSVDVADLFSSFFEPDPKLTENCSRETKRKFVETMMETTEFESLKMDTAFHVDASEIAALAMARKLEETTALVEERGKELSDIEAVCHVGEGLKEADKEVETAREAAEACGMGPGSKGSHNPRRSMAIYRKVKDNPVLRKICELAGKMRRCAAALQRSRKCHGQNDVVGVTMAADLVNQLPTEMMAMMMPELELDWLRRFTEEQLSCFDHKSLEPVAKGPIIISVDESGSMEGSKVETAKALALTMAWIARQQKRWCGLVAYSGDTGSRLLAMPPGKVSEMELLNWLEPFIGGGSYIDVPIRELPTFYATLGSPVGETDVIMITDAICNPNDKLIENFNAWRKEKKVKTYGLCIQSKPGKLEEMCDQVWNVPAIELTEEAVKTVLSI